MRPHASAKGRPWFHLLVIVAAIVAATLSSPSKMDSTPLLARQDQMSDLQLYHAVASQVAQGRGYYAAAIELQRANDFPVRPFVTVRLPTLAWAQALLGIEVLFVIQVALLLAGACAWFWFLSSCSRPERYAAAVLYAVFGGSMIGTDAVAQHEVWAGLLVSLALPLSGRFPVPAILLGLAASLVRELAAPFLALIALAGWSDRDTAISLKAIGAMAVVGIAMAGHYLAVSAFTHPGDPSSQGWMGWGGPRAVATDMSVITAAGDLPAIVYAIFGFLPMFGWLSLAGRVGRLSVLWFGGVLLAVMVIARPDNLRWIDMLMPAYFVGLALVPRFFAGLAASSPSVVSDAPEN